MKKLILVFGADGYIATSFMKKYSDEYDFLPVFGPRNIGVTSLLCVDMTREDVDVQMNKVARYVESLDRKINGVLFLQGIDPSEGINEIDRAHFIKMMTVNLFGPIAAIRAMAPFYDNDVAISFVSSVSVLKGSYDPSYCCSKTAIQGLVKCVNNNFKNLRANAVMPGLIQGSPVHMGMSSDFVERHLGSMNGSLVKVGDVCSTLRTFIENQSIRETMVPLHRGMRG